MPKKRQEVTEPRRRFAAKPLATARGQERYFVDLSHTVEDSMISYKSLPAPRICDFYEPRGVEKVPCERDNIPDWKNGVVSRYVEESGVRSVFFVFRDQVVTPALTGTILAGITRDSVITLLRDMGFRLKEDRISIDDVFKNYERGELLECFGTGTAATVSHVRRLRYKDQTLELPPVEQRKIGLAVRERLIAIRTGKVPDPYAWVEAL